MRILLIDENDSFRHFLITSLENHLRNIDVIEATSLKVAKMLYDSDPYFECILTSIDFSQGSALKVIHHIQNFNPSIPIVTYSDEAIDQKIDRTHFISKSTKHNPQHFIEQLIHLGVFANFDKHSKTQKKYAHIKIFYLWRFESLPFDLYIKINEKKYVKVLAKGNQYDQQFIEKYHTSKNEYLYLDSSDYPKLEALLYNDDWFENMQNLSQEERNNRMKKIIQNMTYSMGLTPQLIQKAQEVVNFVVANINQSKKMSHIFNQRNKKLSLQANISTLTSYLTSCLCDELKWTTKSSKEKLAFAAIFQDTSLKSSRLSSIFYLNMGNIDDLKLTSEELKDLLQHPNNSAQMVAEINLKYPQVEDIIKHHHERPDGTGFPEGINFQKIPPLSSLFIVAHDYVMRSLLGNFEKSNAEILDEMKLQYQKGHFIKCFNALEKIISENTQN